MAAKYMTRQQHVVLDGMFRHGRECLTASKLAELLHQESQEVGLTTVYRQLEKLSKQGLVHKIITEDGAFYQYCEKHGNDCFLLRCEQCGKVEHLDCSHLGELYSHLLNEHRFQIDLRRTLFYGLCSTCQEASI